VIILAYFFYWSIFSSLESQKEEIINEELASFAARYENDGFVSLRLLLAERMANQTPGDPSIYLLADDRFRPLMGNISQWPSIVFDKDGWLEFTLFDSDGTASNLVQARATPIGKQFNLLIGQSKQDIARVRNQLLRALIWALIMMGGLALVGAAMMRRTITRRLDEINRTSRKIMQGNIQERIETRDTRDEFDELAGNLNEMLDQIELGINNVRRVSDNIAHDLKTPLARIKNRLERLRIEVAGNESNEKMVNRIATDADGLLETFNALLRIARIEAHEKKEGFKELDLISILSDVSELYEPVTEEKGLTFEYSANIDTMPYTADRDMLFQAITNLLDNAVKFTPDNGKVSLTAERDGRKGYKICIADSGPGIPESEYKKVTQRFYRMEWSRTTPGSGLGLALVSAILQLHEMDMTFGDNKPGLRVEIYVPRNKRS